MILQVGVSGKNLAQHQKSNTGDMVIFDDENICDKLNDKYVFLGFNKSDIHGKQEAVPWKNFHSDYTHQQD